MFFYDMSSTDNSHVAPAVVGSFASLAGGVGRAISNFTNPVAAQVSTVGDNIPVFLAIVTGVMGIGWSIYKAGPNKLVETLVEENKELREQLVEKKLTIKAQDSDMVASLAERNRLLSEIGRLGALLADAQARLNANAQPPPAPNAA
jgi:hypothetical protein